MRMFSILLVGATLAFGGALAGCNKKVAEEKQEKTDSTGKTVQEHTVEQTPSGGTKTVDEKVHTATQPNP